MSDESLEMSFLDLDNTIGEDSKERRRPFSRYTYYILLGTRVV